MGTLLLTFFAIYVPFAKSIERLEKELVIPIHLIQIWLWSLPLQFRRWTAVHRNEPLSSYN